jgi:hypothetical protein
MTIERSNAKIIGTTLDIEDHGCLTFFVHLDYGESEQGFGGYALDKRSGGSGEFAVRAIRGVLETVGVNDWEDLVGCYVRVDYDHGCVHRIGHIIDNKWLSLKDLASESEEEQK